MDRVHIAKKKKKLYNEASPASNYTSACPRRPVISKCPDQVHAFSRGHCCGHSKQAACRCLLDFQTLNQIYTLRRDPVWP